MNNCKFKLAWRDDCGKEADEDGFCLEHKNAKCSCGKQALGECDYATSLVCGYYTCDGHNCHNHREKI